MCKRPRGLLPTSHVYNSHSPKYHFVLIIPNALKVVTVTLAFVSPAFQQKPWQNILRVEFSNTHPFHNANMPQDTPVKQERGLYCEISRKQHENFPVPQITTSPVDSVSKRHDVQIQNSTHTPNTPQSKPSNPNATTYHPPTNRNYLPTLPFRYRLPWLNIE